MEGKLRYREFVAKKQKKSKNGDHKIRVAEIHLSKIAKLDRAEKRDSDAPEIPHLCEFQCRRPETSSNANPASHKNHMSSLSQKSSVSRSGYCGS